MIANWNLLSEKPITQFRIFSESWRLGSKRGNSENRIKKLAQN